MGERSSPGKLFPQPLELMGQTRIPDGVADLYHKAAADGWIRVHLEPDLLAGLLFQRVLQIAQLRRRHVRGRGDICIHHPHLFIAQHSKLLKNFR